MQPRRNNGEMIGLGIAMVVHIQAPLVHTVARCKANSDIADLYLQAHWQREKWRLRTGTHTGFTGCSCAARGHCARLELQCVFSSKAHLKRRLERCVDSGMSWDCEGLCGTTKGVRINRILSRQVNRCHFIIKSNVSVSTAFNLSKLQTL